MSKKIAATTRIKDSLSCTKLIGRKTKKEEEIRESLIRWHKNSDKRNFFIGEPRRQSF